MKIKLSKSQWNNLNKKSWNTQELEKIRQPIELQTWPEKVQQLLTKNPNDFFKAMKQFGLIEKTVEAVNFYTQQQQRKNLIKQKTQPNPAPSV